MKTDSLNGDNKSKFPRNSRESVIVHRLWLYFLKVFRQITKNIYIYIRCTDGTATYVFWAGVRAYWVLF